MDCPNCHTGTARVFHRISGVPVNSCVLLQTAKEARDFPRGSIDLTFCENCGFVFNGAFEQGLVEYSQRYEATQGFSQTFRTFQTDLASRLISRYGLREKTLLEVGCGKGDFLSLLCDLGENTGIGFDPAYVPEPQRAKAKNRVQFVREFYSEKHSGHKADFLCCNMTLEHIPQPLDFMRMIRRSLETREHTPLFFMVPDATRILCDGAFEDIYYEHCSYFTPASLSMLLQCAAFTVLRVAHEYEGQYVTIEATPGVSSPVELSSHEKDRARLADYVARFPERFAAQRDTWDRQLQGFSQSAQKVVLWGSGSKAVSFLTTSNIPSAIDYVVDINPVRHGHFMPGTGQKIVSLAFLHDYDPDVVILMNPIYRGEVAEALRTMNLSPQLLTIRDLC